MGIKETENLTVILNPMKKLQKSLYRKSYEYKSEQILLNYCEIMFRGHISTFCKL
jgi:hypothetical protein